MEEKNLNHLKLAEDIDLILDRTNKTIQMLARLQQTSKRAGLKIDISKIQLMINLVVNRSDIIQIFWP